MSRTYKDYPSRLRNTWEYERKFFNEYGYWPTLPTPSKKKRSQVDPHLTSMGSVPGEFRHESTTKRRRREGTIYEASLKNSEVDYDMLEYEDPPINWNKPEEYYW